MRVLYFTRDLNGHDHRFLAALARTDHKIDVLRLERKNTRQVDPPLPVGVEQINWLGGRGPVNWKDGPSLVSDLKSVLRRIQPDLVHAGTVQTAAFLTALAGFKPLVTMTWGSDLLVDADRNPLWSLVTQYTLKRTAVMVGDCQAVRNKAVRLGFPSERIVTFPWGVDLDRFQPGESTLKNRLGWGDCFVILSLRSWEPIYGVELLVSAFLRAAQVVPQLRLILLGDGSRRESIRTLLANSGLEERVYLGGLTENEQLPEYYRAADVYVSASYSDGSSVSLMEALACGLPVLVSDIPGNCEWVQEGEQGWLFPTGDEDALASAMVKAYEQRDDMPHMAQACRTLAEARADWNKNFQGLLAAYELAAGYRQGI